MGKRRLNPPGGQIGPLKAAQGQEAMAEESEPGLAGRVSMMESGQIKKQKVVKKVKVTKRGLWLRYPEDVEVKVKTEEQIKKIYHIPCNNMKFGPLPPAITQQWGDSDIAAQTEVGEVIFEISLQHLLRIYPGMAEAEVLKKYEPFVVGSLEKLARFKKPAECDDKITAAGPVLVKLNFC